MTKTVCEKVRELYCEILSARTIVKDIIDTLKFCNDTTNLTQNIGIFARQMPEFKILSEQKVACISYIRQVCTGEISTEKALELFHMAQKQLDEALEHIHF